MATITAQIQRQNSLSVVVQRQRGLSAAITPAHIGTICTAPVADFTASATNVERGDVVQFVDTSTNNPTSWSWKVNNVEVSTSQHPQYTVTLAPSATPYTVALTAANAAGSNTETKTGYLTVRPSIDYKRRPGAWAFSEFILYLYASPEYLDGEEPRLDLMNRSDTDRQMRVNIYDADTLELLFTNDFTVFAQGLTPVTLSDYVEPAPGKDTKIIAHCYLVDDEGESLADDFIIANDFDVYCGSRTLVPASGYLLRGFQPPDYNAGNAPSAKSVARAGSANMFRSSTYNSTNYLFIHNLTHLTGQSNPRTIIVGVEFYSYDGTLLDDDWFAIGAGKTQFVDISDYPGIAADQFFVRGEISFTGAPHEIVVSNRLLVVFDEADGAQAAEWVRFKEAL